METGQEFYQQNIISSISVSKIFNKILEAENVVDREKEHFWAVGLTVKNNIKYIELVSLGVLNMSMAHPRECFRFAIMQATGALIFVHNHPSGDPQPSNKDNTTTSQLVKAGEILGIKVLDHIILGKGKLFSYADEGLIDQYLFFNKRN